MSPRVIVYGGRGALGAAAVSAFKKLQWVGNNNRYISHIHV